MKKIVLHLILENGAQKPELGRFFFPSFYYKDTISFSLVLIVLPPDSLELLLSFFRFSCLGWSAISLCSA